MNQITKNSLLAAFLTGVITFALQYGIMYLPFGSRWLSDPYGDWKIFFPIWTFIYMIAGYVIAKKYQLKKQQFFPLDQKGEEKIIERQKELWRHFKFWKAGNYLIILAKICAIAFPFYILAYIDKSEHLRSSITAIVFLGVVALLFFVAGRGLKKRYNFDEN